MMFSDVDLLSTNSLSDDLNQNSVPSVIFANVPEFTASDRFVQTRSVFKFYMRVCTHAKKLSVFLPPIANVLFISIKCFVGKLFVDFCVFANSYMRLRSDRCVIEDKLHKRVEVDMPKVFINMP